MAIYVAIAILAANLTIGLSMLLFFWLRERRAAPLTVNVIRTVPRKDMVPRSNLILEQLSEDATAVIDTFPIHLQPCGSGKSISGPDSEGDVVLKSNHKVAPLDDCSNTVSRMHAVVAVDEKGFFIQDNDSLNGMFLPGVQEHQEELDIRDGTVILLGTQPIRFRIPYSSGKI